MASVPKLNMDRPHGVYGEIKDGIPGSYIGQDGHLFDMRTHEWVRDVDGAVPGPVESFSCKECGKTYKVGRTAASRALAMSNMKKHLAKKHGIELPRGDE